MTTAVSAHPWARPQAAKAKPDGLRRTVGTLHEPNTWTVGLVLATGIVLIARHPIARALGTEVPAAPVVATEAPARPHTAIPVPTLALPTVAVPTHAPRDPFRALVTASGKVLAPVDHVTTSRPAAPPVAPPVGPATAPSAAPTVSAASCSGNIHRVVAGDTLWSLAARAVRSSDTDRVTLAWHRLYADNRAVVGADPAVLRVGAALCMPQSL